VFLDAINKSNFGEARGNTAARIAETEQKVFSFII
jgi:hypothetical protein